MMERRGQQEIAGFVIIVVIVVVAALIFMVISARNKESGNDSLEVSSLLGAILKQTTDCVVQEPLPLSVEELIHEAYGSSLMCKNGVSTRDYLNSVINETMENVLRLETRFEAYQIDIFAIDGESEIQLGRFYKGNCGDKAVVGAERTIRDVRVWLRVCLNSYD